MQEKQAYLRKLAGFFKEGESVRVVATSNGFHVIAYNDAPSYGRLRSTEEVACDYDQAVQNKTFVAATAQDLMVILLQELTYKDEITAENQMAEENKYLQKRIEELESPDPAQNPLTGVAAGEDP